jgi:two-component system response regulator AtoC
LSSSEAKMSGSYSAASPAREITSGQPLSVSRPWVSGVSPAMQLVQKLIDEIAPTDIPVLIMGESGVGKEIAALRVHQRSQYRDMPFLKLSCAVLTSETLQTQMGALRLGRKEKAENIAGTVFFDEIGELSADCQRSLLHCIADENGTSNEASMPCRYISCTTRDLETEVQAGRFRSDVFYRLNQISLRLPPLRSRKEDIPVLLQFFLQKYSRAFHRQEMVLNENTVQMLMNYHWPGNIRELENVVKKIVALENQELGIAELRPRPPSSQIIVQAQVPRSLKAASRAASQMEERKLILQTLERTRWNRKEAARALQISYKALLYKLKQIQLSDGERL